MTNFTLNNGNTYTEQDNGYCFVTINGKKTRCKHSSLRVAYEQYVREENARQNAANEFINIDPISAKTSESAETIKAYWMATMAITETREQMDEAWATEEGMQDLMDWYEGEKEAGLTEEDMQKAIAETKLDAAAENPEISLEQFAELVQEAEESATTEEIKEIQKEMAPKAKKVRKPRKSKDIAYTYYTDDEHTNALFTLTAKQVDFIRHLPDTMFWERGLESEIWVDCLCDDIQGQFAGKPMTVGAMISTLCEKGLGTRATSRRDGRKCTSFCLTEMGQAVAAEVGLH